MHRGNQPCALACQGREHQLLQQAKASRGFDTDEPVCRRASPTGIRRRPPTPAARTASAAQQRDTNAPLRDISPALCHLPTPSVGGMRRGRWQIYLFMGHRSPPPPFSAPTPPPPPAPPCTQVGSDVWEIYHPRCQPKSQYCVGECAINSGRRRWAFVILCPGITVKKQNPRASKCTFLFTIVGKCTCRIFFFYVIQMM